jgi:hypothetical protein
MASNFTDISQAKKRIASIGDSDYTMVAGKIHS